MEGERNMTSKFIDLDIRADEGFRAEAYPDPLSGGDPWTVGFGCTGPGIVKGTVWTLIQASKEQMKRRQAIEVALDRAIGWWRQLSDERQDVLVNMAYQLGVAGMLAFHHTLTAAQAGEYDAAAAEMLDSHWATQTPKRAKRLALQMRTGARAGQTAPFDYAVDATNKALG